MPTPFSTLAPARRGGTVIDTHHEVVQTYRPLGFFDLPQEVRDRIYSYLLDTNVVHYYSQSQYVPMILPGDMFTLIRSPWDLETTVTRVNARLHEEATALFCKSNLFLRIAILAPDAEFAAILFQEIAANVSLHGTLPDRLERSTQHTADVRISIQGSASKRSMFMIPCTSLMALVHLLSTLCNVSDPDNSPLSSVSIAIRQIYGISNATIQRSLLDPWRELLNVPSVQVKWKEGNQDFVTQLERDMTQKTFNTDAWLKSVCNLKDNGTRAFENGMLESATQYFEQAIATIKKAYRDIPGSGRSELLSKGDEFSRSVSRIRFNCELNISMAWINLEDRFEQASKAAQLAYDISQNNISEDERRNDPPTDTSWYTDEDRATALFCHGSAATAQGAFETACDDFEEARRLNPQDSGIARAADQARRRLTGS